MPVISAILIAVVVLAVWLAGLSVALLGMFRAIPVSATVVAVCALLLTGGSVIVAVAAAMSGLIGVPVNLCVLVTIRITFGHAAFAHQHRPRRSADRASYRAATTHAVAGGAGRAADAHIRDVERADGPTRAGRADHA